MIYTLTLNPSLDLVMDLAAVASGAVNRARYERFVPGGKGLNVSFVLKELGLDSRAHGFVAGFTGEKLRAFLRERGIQDELLALPAGETRVNVKLRADTETDLNAPGPDIPPFMLSAVKDRLSALSAGDVLVLAGSIPPGVPASFYAEILAEIRGSGVLYAVDTAGEALRQCLPEKPFLLKPNRAELAELSGKPLVTDDELAMAAGDLQTAGAKNVLISLGRDGAMLVCEDGTRLRAAAPRGTFVGAVGAGDSMLAGFLAGWLETHDLRHAFRLAVAAGSATAFTDWLADKNGILALYEKVEIR